jgi:hypothetical protein
VVYWKPSYQSQSSDLIYGPDAQPEMSSRL